MLGPAPNTPIAQLQTIPATAYPYKYLQTKSEMLQFYARSPQVSNRFTSFLVCISLNATYGCCFFTFGPRKVRLSFPSQQKGRINF